MSIMSASKHLSQHILGICDACLLIAIQRIHVSAKTDGTARSIGERSNHPHFCQASVTGYVKSLQLSRQEICRSDLFECCFRIVMEKPPSGGHLIVTDPNLIYNGHETLTTIALIKVKFPFTGRLQA